MDSAPQTFYHGLPTGTGLGKYRILERIWTSHNAVVYKARDSMLDRLVTIKQMVPSLMDNPIACGLFKREAQFLARIPKNARYVVNIHELIEDDRGLFIIGEFAAGQWLESLISKRLTEYPGAIRALKTAALGLRTLHSLSIVHRSLHPGAIIVSRSFKARISNLTTAAHQGDTTPPPMITPKYAAPELLLGDAYDDRVDIYSLGFSLYEFCVGRRTLYDYFGPDVEHPVSAVGFWTEWHTDLRRSLPDASRLNPAVPAPLAAILRRMTAKQLDDRYSTIQQVLDAIARQFEPQLARPPLGVRQVWEEPPHLAAPQQQTRTYLLQVSATGPLPTTGPASTRASNFLPGPITPQRPLPTIRQAAKTPAVRVAPTRPRLPTPDSRTPPVTPSAVAPSTPAPVRRSVRVARRRQVRPVCPQIVPAPEPVVELHKTPRLRPAAWAAAAVLLFATLGLLCFTAWYYGSGPGLTHPIQQILADGLAAYDRGDYEAARDKLLEAAGADVDVEKFVRLRDRASRWLPMAEAQLALARDDFDEALEWIREAKKVGFNPAKVSELQQLCWMKKDAYRLATESARALERGQLADVEVKLDEYEEKARAAGLRPEALRERLELSRRERDHEEILARARETLAKGDFERALRECTEAEMIKPTKEAKELHQKITTAKERAEWILRGNEAMLDKEYEDAASFYQKANKIEATPDIEEELRTAQAYILLTEAHEEIAAGDLIQAEQSLRAALWKAPIPQVKAKLEQMEPAFAAAKLVRKGDHEFEYARYADAERLYTEAMSTLPAPANAAVKTKILLAQQASAVQQGDDAFARGDWSAALAAYERARRLGRNGDTVAKIEAAKAKLRSSP